MFSLFLSGQQECDELYQNIDTLKGKNKSLTEQLRSLSEECEALINENDSIEVHHLSPTPIC